MDAQAKARSLIEFEQLKEVSEEIERSQEAMKVSYNEEPIRFPVGEVVHLAILSRIAESLRFTIPREGYDSVVTYESLRRELHRAEAVPDGAESQISGLSASNHNGLSAEEESQRMQKLDEKLKSVWDSWESCKAKTAERKKQIERTAGDTDDNVPVNDSTGLVADVQKMTFNDLLDYQFPHFPETTEADRLKLSLLAKTRPVVSKRDVMKTLDVEEDSQVVQFIFDSGASVLSAEVFKEITSSYIANMEIGRAHV